MKTLRLILLAIFAVFALHAQALAGDIVLTLTSKADPSFKKDYDLAALEAVGLSTFTTTTSWTDGDVVFTGVKIADLLASANLPAGSLQAAAINDYAIEIPAEDLAKYPVMIATKMNGERMAVRDKGPLWIVYPRTDFPELMDESHNGKWIWQLVSLEVR